MQEVLSFLRLVNRYIPYIYIVIGIILIIYLIRLSLSLKTVYGKYDDLEKKAFDIRDKLMVIDIKYQAVINKLRHTFYNIIKALALFKLIRYKLNRDKRERIKAAKKQDKDYQRYRRSIDRLLS